MTCAPSGVKNDHCVASAHLFAWSLTPTPPRDERHQVSTALWRALQTLTAPSPIRCDDRGWCVVLMPPDNRLHLRRGVR